MSRLETSTISTSELEKMFQNLTKGQYVLVDTGEQPPGKPHWFDEAKYRAGQQFVEEYFGGIFYAHLTSLMMMLFSPRALKPLIYSKMSETPRKAYQRYIRTTVHVMSWYRGNVWEPDNVARKSIVHVRNLHSQIAAKTNAPEHRETVDLIGISDCGKPLNRGPPLLPFIQEDLSNIPDCPHKDLLDVHYNYYLKEPSDPQVPYLNQFDMSLTQFAFMGLIVLHPVKFGLGRASPQQLEGFIHMWRCFGYLLGIRDQFNFCSLDSLQEVRCFISYCLHRCVIPTFKTSISAEYEHMARAVALGTRPYIRNSSFERLFLYVTWVVELPVPSVRSKIDLVDKCRFCFSVFVFRYLGNLPLGNKLINYLVDLAVRLVLNPPQSWPAQRRPPHIPGLYHLWKPV